MLFPKLAAIYGNMYYSYDSLLEWRRQGRICSPDIFDTFFRLSIPEGDISRNEIEAILSQAKDPDAFAGELLKLNEEGKAIRFLERLEDYTRNQIPVENVGPIISALMDIGDLLPEGEPGSLSTDTSLKILRLTHQLSQRFENRNDRFIVLRNAIEKSTRSLYTIVHEISIQTAAHDKHDSKETAEPEERLTLNNNQLKELQKLVCTKIEIWAKNGKLAQSNRLPTILFNWERWAQPGNVIEFVNTMIKADDGLVNFITSFLSPTTSGAIGSYVKRVHWHISLKNIGHFVDVKAIEPRIRRLASTPIFEKLDERKKLAINVFLDTIDGKIKDPFEGPE